MPNRRLSKKEREFYIDILKNTTADGSTFKWNDHPTYQNYTVHKDNFIDAGSSEEVILTVKSKFIDKNVDSSLLKSIPITITLDYGVWDKGTLPKKEDLAVLMSTGCYLPGYDVNSTSVMQLNDFENVVCPEIVGNLQCPFRINRCRKKLHYSKDKRQ